MPNPHSCSCSHAQPPPNQVDVSLHPSLHLWLWSHSCANHLGVSALHGWHSYLSDRPGRSKPACKCTFQDLGNWRRTEGEVREGGACWHLLPTRMQIKIHHRQDQDTLRDLTHLLVCAAKLLSLLSLFSVTPYL